MPGLSIEHKPHVGADADLDSTVKFALIAGGPIKANGVLL